MLRIRYYCELTIKEVNENMNQEREQLRIEKLEALCQRDVMNCKVQRAAIVRKCIKWRILYLQTANKRMRDIIRIFTRRKTIRKEMYSKRKKRLLNKLFYLV